MPPAAILINEAGLSKKDVVFVIKAWRAKSIKQEHRFNKDQPIATLSKDEIFKKFGEIGFGPDIFDEINLILGITTWDHAALVDFAMAAVFVANKNASTPSGSNVTSELHSDRGVKRKSPSDSDEPVLNKEFIDSRIQFLDGLVADTKYEKQKENLSKKLLAFLHLLDPLLTLDNVSPAVMRQFLVWMDSSGKTKVHFDKCQLKATLEPVCSCPLRRAATSLDTLIGQLRAIFRDYGRGTDWNNVLGFGNPMAAPSIKKHLKAVKLEQSRSLVESRQAIPIFMDKVIKMSRFISYSLHSNYSNLSKKKRYALARDKAYFSLMCFTGDRAADLGRLKFDQIRWLPQRQGIYIHMSEGKTVKGDPRRIVVNRVLGGELCPIKELEDYLKVLSELGLDFSGGFLFRPCGASRDVLVSDKPVSSSTMTPRLKKHLESAGLWSGETPHGFRSGCAITLKQCGASNEVIKDHVGWQTDNMVDKYTSPSEYDKTSSTMASCASNALGGDNVSRNVQIAKKWKSLDTLL